MGRNFFRFLMVFTMYFGGGLVPFYLLIKALGLIDSFWVMVLPTGVSVTYMLIISSNMSALPKELEEPYLSYNVLQRAQGFDLEPCCGKTVERCTYTVKNHPSGKVCQADLYICGGEIVAGDILCTGEGGFIAPLAFPKDA